MRRALVLLLLGAVLAAGAGAIFAWAAGGDDGRIGPERKLLGSGRQLTPLGELVPLGNFPTGGAATPDGRFYWTVSTGRGRNDVRVVSVADHRVIQTLQLPGASGGIVMDPAHPLVYVSGVSDSNDAHADQQLKGAPGREGDVLHVFSYDGASGQAKFEKVLPVPAPSDAPTPQNFPPTNSEKVAWPDRLAISPDGGTLLVPLNLADAAAVVKVATGEVRYVKTGNYPYGAAILPDGKTGLVSNETPGTVSVVDLEKAEKVKDVQVGPHLSHPEAIAVDPQGDRAYVAVANSDQVAVIDLRRQAVERTLSVERPEGNGASPVDVSVTPDGGALLVAEAGADEISVFNIPGGPASGVVTLAAKRAASCPRKKAAKRRTTRKRAKRSAKRRTAKRRTATRCTKRKKRKKATKRRTTKRRSVAAKTKRKARKRKSTRRHRAKRRPAKRPKAKTPAPPAPPPDFTLAGRIPVADYPTDVEATAPAAGRPSRLLWVAAKGLGTGANPNGPNPLSPNDSDAAINSFQYLPSITNGQGGIAPLPTFAAAAALSEQADRQLRPSNSEEPPADTPLRANGPIKHVFYIVRENRTYDQVLGDVAKGDGDPNLTLFGKQVTPTAHALADRFPLLDHVYANSEASIDGHFWTSAAKVSDYVNKAWHPNYGGRNRPYDFGVYAVTWPGNGFLFDQAERQGISYFNYGEAVAGVVPLTDKDRTPEETQEVSRKLAKSDLGPPDGCYANDASINTDAITTLQTWDSTPPPEAAVGAESRFDCFRAHFTQQLAAGNVPAFNYLVVPNDHTVGLSGGQRTPRALVADNDYGLGQIVDLISKSSIWKESAIFVVEDDSQDGADHVDAHRIPAFAISPYAKRGAVVHTRYDLLSVIRSMELIIGMKPLGLFDRLATPMYDAFQGTPANADPFDVPAPTWDRTEKNADTAANARLSRGLNLRELDRVPQRELDAMLWKSVHGIDSVPPPPGPNASGRDEAEADDE